MVRCFRVAPSKKATVSKSSEREAPPNPGEKVFSITNTHLDLTINSVGKLPTTADEKFHGSLGLTSSSQSKAPLPGGDL